MEDIVNRLESANEFCESMEARQLRKDAAEEIRKLRQKIEDLGYEVMYAMGNNDGR